MSICTAFEDDNTFDATTTTYDETYTTETSISFDSDGDGYAETAVFDLDGDGIADAYDIIDPATGMETLVLDADGDGSFDTALTDYDGDGTFDETIADLDGDGWYETTLDAGTEATETTTDPFEDLDADVHGDPMAEIEYHQAQASDNDCLPTSVAMVISEMTGTDVPAGELVDLAEELDVLDPDGMTVDNGVRLLEHYGVEAEGRTGSLDELRTMLDADVPVIIALDADDIYGTGDAPFADDTISGHAVVITGIDDEAGLVYINDPGFPDGAGVAVPIDVFEDAWTDFDHQMIVVEDADEAVSVDDAEVTAEPADATGTMQGEIEGSVGDADRVEMVLIPFALKLL